MAAATVLSTSNYSPPSSFAFQQQRQQLIAQAQLQQQLQHEQQQNQQQQPFLPPAPSPQPRQYRPIAAVAVPATAPMDPAAARNALRSCTTCSKAKAKCVRLPGQSVCERCARLRKECHSREPTVRRKKNIKTTRAAQLEKLESKIEHLVNALSVSQAQREIAPVHSEPSPPASEGSFRSSTRQSDVVNALCYDDAEDDNCSLCPTNTTGTTPATFSTSQITSPSSNTSVHNCHALGVSMQEAEVLLERFKRLLAPSFPFILIPEHATVASLQAEKPLLLHAIVQVTSFQNLVKQQTAMKLFMRDVSERVMINSEKSLDIVQGILVVCAWYHPYLFVMQQITNLLHIATALVLDLGLDRPPLDCVGDLRGPTIRGVKGTLPTRATARDEFRALAGLYYLTSMVSSSFRKMDPIPYSKYLQEAIEHLEKTQEFESDKLLVQLVQSQHLLQDASTVDTEAPIPIYIRAFTSDLDKMRRNDPFKAHNTILHLQYQVVEISILELSLNELQEHSTSPLHSHLENLWRLVESVKEYINAFFTIPVTSYHLLPFSLFGQFAHTFILLTKIASLEVDGLDNRDLQDRLSFIRIVDDIADRFDQTAEVDIDGLHVSNPCFANWATRARWMKSMYASRFGARAALAASSSSTSTGVVTSPSNTSLTQQQDKSSTVVSPAPSLQFTPSSTTTPGSSTTPSNPSGPDSGRLWNPQPSPFPNTIGQSPESLEQQHACQIEPSEQQHSLHHQQQQQATAFPLPAHDELMSGDFFQYLDENFWQSFAGEFNLQDVAMT